MWCWLQQDILCEAVRLTLKKHKEVAKQEELLYKRHGNWRYSISSVSTSLSFSLARLHITSTLSLPFPPPPPPLEVSPVLCGGNNRIELYVFDVHKQSISIHQPLARVLAGMSLSLSTLYVSNINCHFLPGLLTGADAHSCSLTHLLQISPTVSY